LGDGLIVVALATAVSQQIQIAGVQRAVPPAPSTVTVTSVSPATGDVAGGDTVTVVGTGFVGGTPTVTFGGQAATSVSILDSTSISCVTPAVGAGAVNVIVTLSGGGSGTGTGVFTYQALTVTGISPASGAAAGGTAVTITGTGFQTGDSVTIGGVSATSIVRVSPTSITCVTPAGTEGARDVVIAGAVTLTGGFTYTAGASTFFSSRWDTATGTSTTAVLDGAKWHGVGGDNLGGTVLEVVAPGSMSPAWTGDGNVLRESSIQADYEIGNSDVTESTSHYVRVYVMWSGTGFGRRNHNGAYDPKDSIDVVWLGWWDNGAAGICPSVAIGAFEGGPGGGITANPALNLAFATWYRLEWYMEYLTATTFRLWPRIYNMAGTLVFDSDDYLNKNDTSETLTEFYTAGGFGTCNGPASETRECGFGNSTGVGNGVPWLHWAKFDMSYDTWIGA
jgi:hypothetical protein